MQTPGGKLSDNKLFDKLSDNKLDEKLLNGKLIAQQIQLELKRESHHLRQNLAKRAPCLAFILVGEHPASKIYVKRKTQACEAVGFTSIVEALAETTAEKDLLKLIDELNHNPLVDGILVQMPLPKHIDQQKVMLAISPAKDVDGFHPLNMGKLLLGDSSGFTPCTPLGIQVLLERYQICTQGKHVAILGRSNIVGKPLAALLMQKQKNSNATVTLLHSHSKDIAHYTRQADILIAAMGHPLYVTADFVREGAVVIDVGINRQADSNKVVGDVDFAQVIKKASAITPVPGGVGPMTIAMLLANTLKSYKQKISPLPSK